MNINDNATHPNSYVHFLSRGLDLTRVKKQFTEILFSPIIQLSIQEHTLDDITWCACIINVHT